MSLKYALISKITRAITFVVLFCITGISHAHQNSNSFLTLNTKGHILEGQWAIAVRDIDLLTSLDLNANGEITWGEIRQQAAAIKTIALNNLNVMALPSKKLIQPEKSQLTACPGTISDFKIDNLSDGAYIVLPLQFSCETIAANLSINYSLLFDIDTQHRGLVNISNGSFSSNVIFSPTESNLSLNLDSSNWVSQLVNYALQGIWHIWNGFDHILFLITLLLPSVLIWKSGNWLGVNDWRMALIETIKIVTAFSVAHSMTLALVSFGVIRLNTQLVEIIIAISVLLACINNIYPITKLSRWSMALGFGLIHGFGFASVLGNLNSSSSSIVVPLFGFNLGVELGQLAIVLTWFPLAYLLRSTHFYRHSLLKHGSAVIGVVAIVWIYERALMY